MIDLKELQSVLHNVQQVMAGYSQDDTWSDYDRKSHAELIKMQYIVEDELKTPTKMYSGNEVAEMMKASYRAGSKDLADYNKLNSASIVLEAQAKTNTNDMSLNDEPSAP